MTDMANNLLYLYEAPNQDLERAHERMARAQKLGFSVTALQNSDHQASSVQKELIEGIDKFSGVWVDVPPKRVGSASFEILSAAEAAGKKLVGMMHDNDVESCLETFIGKPQGDSL